MKETVHLLLTRFNARFPELKFSGYRENDTWLVDRLKLFQTYCLPSVNNQTVRDFKWLVFFDSATPDKFKEQILALSQKNTFIPLYNSCFDQAYIKEIIEEFAPLSLCSRLLTSRLDNDDAIHPTFIARLQSSYSINTKEILSFPQGVILSHKKLYRVKDELNPFITLSEPRSGAEGVFARSHTRLFSERPLVVVDQQTAWMQVVHGRNLMNRVRGDLITEIHEDEEFAVFLGKCCQPSKTTVFLEKNFLKYYRIFVNRLIQLTWWIKNRCNF